MTDTPHNTCKACHLLQTIMMGMDAGVFQAVNAHLLSLFLTFAAQSRHDRSSSNFNAWGDSKKRKRRIFPSNLSLIYVDFYSRSSLFRFLPFL